MVAPEESAALYRAAREQVIGAARRLTDDQLATRVPGCPRWTARDLLCHQAGHDRDLVEQNLDGAPSEAWTAVHVETRKARPLDEILDEWDEYGARLEEIVLAGERKGRLMNNPYVDTGTHQADLHGAVGTGRPARDVWLASLDFALAGHGKGDEPGSLTVTTEDATYKLGAGDPHLEVTVDSYELFRATFGRRSATQIQSWAWTGDPTPWSIELPRLHQTPHDLTD